jgi:hypothetical protein
MKELSFEQILQSKLHHLEPQQESFERHYPATNVSLEPANLAYLLGSLPVFQLNKGPKRQPQQESKKPIRRSQMAPHQLSEAQAKAKSWFFDRGEDLKADFTKAELKAAFRKLALRLHPDTRHQDSNESLFLRLTPSYNELLKIFKA